MLSVALLTALLAACGGGDEGPPPAAAGATELVRQIAATGSRSLGADADERRFALAATPSSIQATLEWAEWKYASLFPKGPASFALTHLGVAYTVRAYRTGNYLGITANGDIFGLGPFTNDVLTPFGNVADYAAMVQADACQVNPASCPQPRPSGLNECADPLDASLPAGHRVTALYDVEAQGTLAGEASLSFEVAGPATFLNQASTQIVVTSLFKAAVNGPSAPLVVVTDLRSDIYVVPIGNGFWQELGDITRNRQAAALPTQPATETLTQTVNEPPLPNSEFGLRVGQSIRLSTRTTATTLQPPNLRPTTSQLTTDYTYERRETITVGGKSYDTCRYKEVEEGVAEITTIWYIVGKGVAAIIESGSGNDVTRFKLKTYTYGGTTF